jgi:hypothetical protein
MLRNHCAAPLTLYLGTDDVHQNVSEGLDFSENAMKQGPVRLARNHNFFHAMQKLAAAPGWPFNWRIVETPGTGHSGAQMFHAPEIEDALFGPRPGEPADLGAARVLSRGPRGAHTLRPPFNVSSARTLPLQHCDSESFASRYTSSASTESPEDPVPMTSSDRPPHNPGRDSLSSTSGCPTSPFHPRASGGASACPM